MKKIPPPFVSIIGYRLMVDFCDQSTAKFLQSRSYSLDQVDAPELSRFIKPTPESRASLAEELMCLRDSGIVFAEGKGWSPAAQFQQLKEEGLASGKFDVIYFQNAFDPLEGWHLKAAGD